MPVMSKSQPHRSPAGMAASVKTPTLTIALAGNPNAGKTSLFNALTGLNQGVGNFPANGRRRPASAAATATIGVVDLPGTYSLICLFARRTYRPRPYHQRRTGCRRLCR